MLRIDYLNYLNYMETHRTSLIIFLLIIVFAVIHSGGAALRSRAESIMGARYGDYVLFP